MLDEKDLQAIAQLLAVQKKEIISEVDTKLSKQKKEIIGEVNVLMESYFDPKFNALEEKLNPIPREAFDIMEDRLDDAEKMIELHTQQISELKKAQ